MTSPGAVVGQTSNDRRLHFEKRKDSESPKTIRRDRWSLPESLEGREGKLCLQLLREATLPTAVELAWPELRPGGEVALPSRERWHWRRLGSISHSQPKQRHRDKLTC